MVTKEFIFKRSRLERIKFHLEIPFMISSFVFFILFYERMFPEIEEGNLINPLQIIAQLTCFLFNFKYSLNKVRERNLLLLCFVLSILSSLFTFLLPLNFTFFVIFSLYFIDAGLAKWGFFLAFQLGAYYLLAFFLEKGQSLKKDLLPHIMLLITSFFWGFVYYDELYLRYPVKLAALLSGACILFLSFSKRPMWAFRLAFFFYFILSLFIGVMSAPGDKATIWGIPVGIFIFFFIHFWLLLGFFVFQDRLPSSRKLFALIPFFFSGLFIFFFSLPEIAYLKKWLEGIDLLLLLIGFHSFIEKYGQCKKRKRRSR